jgi:hypothetical protein
MAHLKITFWQKKIVRVSQLQASKGSKRHLLDHICARTFQGLHSVRLWTPTIFIFCFQFALFCFFAAAAGLLCLCFGRCTNLGGCYRHPMMVVSSK